ncbi:hypothetical protein JMJ35_010430 [Cladonia borealis]|uniref:DUF3669 domain-containing protein n=1 Tax=Cladonia borealis TaxID=184061 RepID=A0AA39QQN5_9LECA|nr:hypothetical protein JMJ35_010430 [Cladonia borealis]
MCPVSTNSRPSDPSARQMPTSDCNVFGESYSNNISKGIIPALEYKRLSKPTGSTPEAECLRTIGLGSCGTVFEIPGTELAYKKGTNEAGIWGDFCLTNKVHNAVGDVRNMMHKAFPNYILPKTPMCHAYHTTSDDEFWSANLQLFPESHRTKQPLFLVDKILPLPRKIREDLIKLYFDQDEAVQKEARNNEENKHCLVRVYLGERTSHSHHSQEYDTLRNFPLRVDMMEELNLDISQLAAEMAIGLATLHWEASVDGMDTEFVIGSSATWDLERPRGYDDVKSPPHKVKTINFKRRALHLWMLDFDKATRIELTEHDVDKKLVPAFLGNDPYYPRPQVDEELWDEFCKVYLEASEVILLRKKVKKGVKHLPQRFLDKVVRVSREHEDWNGEDNIVFAN